jgi:hypothetical protein
MVTAFSKVCSAASESFIRPDSMLRKSLIVSLASFALLALLASFSLLGNARSPAAGQQSRAKQSRAKTKAAPPIPTVPDALVPFAVGETLEYQVLWTQYHVHAATLEYSVVEKRDFFGHPAWHFRIIAHTTNTMRTVYPLDDQFDSYTDAAQLTSLQYEQYLRELNSPQNTVYRMSSGAEPASAGASAVKVLPGTRDAVGIVYALRANDWVRAPELDAPVFDGHNVYDVHARLDAATDMVQVPAGQFPATRIAVDIYEGGKLKQDSRFQVWLGKDAARTPLLIEAIVPIGNARVELLSLPKR